MISLSVAANLWAVSVPTTVGFVRFVRVMTAQRSKNWGHDAFQPIQPAGPDLIAVGCELALLRNWKIDRSRKAALNRYNRYSPTWGAVFSQRVCERIESRESIKAPSMNGFLGTRGSFMLDLVFASMLAAVPLLLLSGWLVRYRKQYGTHRKLQMVLSVVLLVAVAAFELEMRLFGWTDRAVDSPFWIDGRSNDWIDYSLMLHLCFAIPTPFIWGFVVYKAMKKFPNPPEPSAHSRSHRFWGRIAMAGLTLTALTGSVFYWLAFAAKA